MSSQLTSKQNFTGPHALLLEELSNLMEKLWQEHLTSPTLAGNEKFYAWGNIDYTIVMSQNKFDDVVDIRTKIGALEIKKEIDGNISCQIVEDKSVKKKNTLSLSSDPAEILEKIIMALNQYYYFSSFTKSSRQKAT